MKKNWLTSALPNVCIVSNILCCNINSIAEPYYTEVLIYLHHLFSYVKKISFPIYITWQNSFVATAGKWFKYPAFLYETQILWLRCQLHFLVPLVVTLLSFVPNDVVCSYFQLTCAHLIEYHIKHRVKRLPMSDLNLFHANDFSISPETFDFLMFTTKKQRQWYEPSTNFQYKHVFPL